MSGGPELDPPGASAPGGLPPLVLRCRPWPRLLHLLAALYLLSTGTIFLSRGLEGPEGADAFLWRGGIGLLLGACAAWYTARYGFARLVIDDRGFALRGPLGDSAIAWGEVIDWRRRPPRGGPFPNILVLYGADRRRLFVPLIYEESHALELGLLQRGFPKF